MLELSLFIGEKQYRIYQIQNVNAFLINLFGNQGNIMA